MLVESTRLGPYEILAPLGVGGMGEVYRARDTRLGREVAVKVLPESLASNTDRQTRFEREARAVAALSHPNILAIHDYGTHGAIVYAVMELLEGETLRERLVKGPLPWREAVEMGAAIADGLAAAHAKGIVHRDLKPENLFLTHDGRVKILDFGLARVEPISSAQDETSPYVPPPTDPGIVMGTVGYMSPEQVRGQQADARSDIFSFGCVLYEMVTGRRAFQRETAAETMTAILHDEPPEPATSGQLVPGEVGRIIRQCLVKTANQRPQSARDLALGLRAAASDPALARTDFKSVLPSRHLIAGIIAASLLIGAIAATVYFLTRHGNPPESGPQGSVAMTPAEEAKAIEVVAVLPFENVGDDPETEYLSDGIPESIIKSLYEVHSLKVRPFSFVSRYKGRGKDLDLQEVGRQLNVQAVLTGKLSLRKDRLSLSVELMEVRDLRGIWHDHFDRPRTDIQAVQDEITQQICAKLGIQLTDQEQKRLIKHYTENTKAYDLYLKGRLQMKKITVGAIKKGIEYFEEAIDTDPHYALAYTGLADSYSTLAQWGYWRARDASPRARKAAEEALKIDATLSEAHTSLAYVKMNFDWEWLAAEEEFSRAIKFDPKNANAQHWYSHYLAAMGRTADSLAASERALELDPLNATFMVHLGWHFYYARQYDLALEQLRKAIDMAPKHGMAHVHRALTYVQMARPEAIDEAQQATLLAPEWSITAATLGYAYAVSGKRDAALKVLDELTALSQWKDVSYYKAWIHTGLGQKEQALEWLEKAYDERSDLLVYLKVDPIFDSLRSEPRFGKLLHHMGLADKAAERDPGIHSVAVLPFKNLGGDPKTEFLSDGVADQIINSLSQVRRKDLKVRPFTSVARYKGKEPDVPKFGRELNVRMIVTGALRQQGDDLAISVALVDVQDDNQLWGDSYHGKLGTILDLQDRIAREVAAQLRLQLSGEEDKRLTKRYTEDPEAYLFYREAIYHFNKFNEEGLKTAIEYCQRAINKDPKYALAYGMAGRCHVLRGTQFQGIRETGPEARKYIEQALKMDEALPEAHSALGALYLFHDWNWEAAERELKRAIAIDSNVLVTRNIYGFWLVAHGRLPEAFANIRHGQELDPLAAPRSNELATCHNWMRQYDQAITEARKALALDPNLARAYGELGLAFTQKSAGPNQKPFYDEALAALQKAVDLGKRQPRMLGLLGYGYVAAGKKPEAQKVLEELRRLAQEGRYSSALAIARIHSALDQKDQAFEWLRKACDERESQVVFLRVDPTLDNLRSDPRFAEILKEMGLPP
jgi:TolB-like protein/Tfp pilus assembly protein PilF